jgi:hypothetical protein
LASDSHTKKNNNMQAIPDLKKLVSLTKGLTQAIDCNSQKNLLSYNFVTNINNLTKVGLALAPQPQAKFTQPTISSEDIIKLISAFFKSIYCLISRPKFINTPDKIIIEILYYITIPDHNIFKWYNFIYPQPKGQKSLSVSKLAPQAKYAAIDRNIIKKNKRKPTIKTILHKNLLIQKTFFKLNNTNIVNLYFNKFAILFKLLQTGLRKKFNNALINKPIEFNLIRMHKSDYDSNILAQLFTLILKKKNIRLAINKIFNKNNIASAAQTALSKGQAGTATIPHLANSDGGISSVGYNQKIAIISGLYIKIGGRLMREPIIPRITTKKFEMGAIATGKVNFVDSARITKKNKKGAFTIKITYAQNFVF